MQDSSLLAGLKPARLGLVAMVDELAERGWPDGQEFGGWWRRSRAHFVNAARRELAMLEQGEPGDHLAIAAINLLQALHCRAQGS